MSSTVTVDSQVLTLPLISVTVKVTVFNPTSKQVQSSSAASISDVATPQASFLPPSISAAVIDALPVTSNSKVISTHNASGGILSTTVTVASQVLVLPFESVTVKVTICVPTSTQVQSSSAVSIVVEAIPQASLLPLSISAAVIVAFPVASSSMVIS